MEYLLANKDAIMDRILKRCEKEGECLVWKGHCNKDGYGRTHVNSKDYCVHRLVLILNTRENPKELCAGHAPIICHKPSCCNIEHLRWVSAYENWHDKIKDGTWGFKISEGVVVDILNSKLTALELAFKHKISKSMVWGVRKGNRWKHIPREPKLEPTKQQLLNRIYNGNTKHLKIMKTILSELITELFKTFNSPHN